MDYLIHTKSEAVAEHLTRHGASSVLTELISVLILSLRVWRRLLCVSKKPRGGLRLGVLAVLTHAVSPLAVDLSRHLPGPLSSSRAKGGWCAGVVATRSIPGCCEVWMTGKAGEEEAGLWCFMWRSGKSGRPAFPACSSASCSPTAREVAYVPFVVLEAEVRNPMELKDVHRLWAFSLCRLLFCTAACPRSRSSHLCPSV